MFNILKYSEILCFWCSLVLQRYDFCEKTQAIIAFLFVFLLVGTMKVTLNYNELKTFFNEKTKKICRNGKM